MLSLFGGGSPNDEKASENQAEQAIEVEHAIIQGRAARMTQASVRFPRASMDLGFGGSVRYPQSARYPQSVRFKHASNRGSNNVVSDDRASDNRASYLGSKGLAANLSPAMDDEEEEIDVVPPKSRFPKRLLTLSWAAFVLVVITLYTAKMTATLVELQQQTKVDSVEACAKQGCTMCTNTVQIDGMRAKYGERIRYKGMGYSSKEVIQASTEPGSGCDVIFASQRDWDFFFKPQFCEWTFLGSHIDEETVSQPVSNELQGIISYWSRKLVEADRWKNIKRDYVKEPECPSFKAASMAMSAEESTEPLTPKHLLGCFMLFFLCAFVALTYEYLQHREWAVRRAMALQKVITTASERAYKSTERACSRASKALSSKNVLSLSGKGSGKGATFPGRNRVGDSAANGDKSPSPKPWTAAFGFEFSMSGRKPRVGTPSDSVEEGGDPSGGVSNRQEIQRRKVQDKPTSGLVKFAEHTCEHL